MSLDHELRRKVNRLLDLSGHAPRDTHHESREDADVIIDQLEAYEAEIDTLRRNAFSAIEEIAFASWPGEDAVARIKAFAKESFEATLAGLDNSKGEI